MGDLSSAPTEVRRRSNLPMSCVVCDDGEMLGTVWGVRDDETRLRFACDDVVQNPSVRAWRGVSVSVPAADLWPWVCQIRAAPYSYDWLDNGGRRSPRNLLGLPEPEVGDSFTASAGRALGRIVDVEPRTSLTGKILGAYMTYLLVPESTTSTRLLLKIVIEKKTNPVLAQALYLGDLVMARKQLLNVKRLAQS